MVSLDESDLRLRGKPIVRAETLPADALAPLPDVVTTVQEFYHQRELLDLGGMTEGEITIAPTVPALRAASLIATVGRRTRRVKVTSGEASLDFHYLPRLRSPSKASST